MIEGVSQNIRRDQPPLAIGRAQSAVAAGPQAGLDLLYKLRGCGLMFQRFQKSCRAEFFVWIPFGKF
jgi:hypothetical protein